MRSITYILIYFVAVFSITLLPSITWGQIVPQALQNVELSASSQNPAPGQSITVTLKGYSANVDGATIVWYVNGTETKRGTGATTLSVKAPDLGKKLTVSATVLTPNGRSYSDELEIGSGSIDVIVETSGYTHPYFKGKLSPVFQNTINIIAIPHILDSNGIRYNPENLVYKWEKDGIVLGNESGYGKQTLTFSGNTVPRPFSVTVTASTRDGTRQARSTTNITFEEPTVVFYANDPLYGTLFNKALSGRVYLGAQREVGVRAVPFGFDKPINDVGSLRLSWTINGNEKDNLSQNESIIVRSPEDSFGTSDIGLHIQSAQYILQSAENIFNVSFKALTESASREDISF